MPWCTQLPEATLDTVSDRGLLPQEEISGPGLQYKDIWKGQDAWAVPCVREGCRKRVCLSTYGSTHSVVLSPGSR